MNNKRTGLEIAIIGMTGRFPGAENLDQFWDNLINGVDSISFFSDEELIENGVSKILVNRDDYVKAKGYIKDIESFDAGFFGYTPQEVHAMDPQIRIFHECSWEALEDAGYNPEIFSGKIGVYAGASSGLFWQNLTMATAHESIGPFGALSLSSKDYLSTRVSYKLNLRGPSVTIYTACSTSLVSIEMACKGLLMGDCQMAIAGGVSVIVPVKNGYVYQEGYIRAKDGHCRTFDEKASGTVFSDGVGVLVLKRLEDAIKDGDSIHAVIKGISVNNDGNSKVGFTAPSIIGQCDVVKKTLYFSGVAPESITYMEAHGTATQLGDLIEVDALKEGFNTKEKNYCAIGSVKTNIGHLDCAAGVAAIIKTSLSIKNRIIPATLNCDQPNPKIDFKNSPFYLAINKQDWQNTNGNPLRAGVSSFGVGGTNAYAVLEEAPTAEVRQSNRKWKLILLSARSENALASIKDKYITKFKDNTVDISDAAYTLQTGRKYFSYRKIAVGSNHNEIIENLSKNINEGRLNENQLNRIVFMFSGQGSQYVDMGLQLYNSEPIFRETMDKCFSIIKSSNHIDLKAIIYPEASNNQSEINQTENTQPLLFAIEYSLAKLLIHWGVQPGIMIGHSIGEYTAACLAEVFSLEEALKIVCLRGRLMQKVQKGSMLSIFLSKEEILPLLTEQLELAVINSAKYCVVSGTIEKIDELSGILKEKGISSIKLHTSHAFHSWMMEPILDEFEEELKKVVFHQPKIPFISNVTGLSITNDQAMDPKYWRNHLRNTVNFEGGINTLSENKDNIFIEIGPGNALSAFVKQNKDVDSKNVVNLIRHPNEKLEDDYFITEKLGQLWIRGVNVNWVNYYGNEKRNKVSLPTYPFEKKKYWIDEKQKEYLSKLLLNLYGEMSDMDSVFSESFQKKEDISEWFYNPTWKKKSSFKDELSGLSKCFVLLSDNNDFGLKLKAKLTSLGHKVYLVDHGKEFNKENDHSFVINPEDQNDYSKLIDQVIKEEKPVSIVHLWSVKANDKELNYQDIENINKLGLYSLINLSKSLSNYDKQFELYIISNNLFKIFEENKLNPDKALLLGPAKLIAKEIANIQCKFIDLDLTDIDQLALENKIIINELADTKDNFIVLRKGFRWAPVYDPIKIYKNENNSKIREQGIYIITGGFGGIGYVLAEYLAKTYKARLILLGRNDFPEESKWEQIIQLNTDNEIIEKINKVRHLQELGAETLVFKADVCDEEKMANVFEKTLQKYHKINGVLHTAGIADQAGLIIRRSIEDTKNVLDPKVVGTLIIAKLIKNLDIDFMMLCSSISSISAPEGEVGYISANSFLDAFAYYNTNVNKVSTISINWGAWQEVGMAVKAIERLRLTKKISLKDEILPFEGIEAFERLLNYGQEQVITSTKDLNRILTTKIVKNRKTDSDKGIREKRPDLSVEFVDATNDFETNIAAIWRNILGLEKIGINDNFFELGANSIDLVQVNSKIKELFNKNVPVVKMYEYPTVKQLSDYLANEGRDSENEKEEVLVVEEPTSNKLKSRREKVNEA